MDHTPRARRRADLARMKAKARRFYPHDPKARSANHLAVCSCWMCGNPRRLRGEGTFSEERAKQAAQDAVRKAWNREDD